MSKEKTWQAITDKSGCMVGMAKCERWIGGAAGFRHVYIHFPLGEATIWTKRVFLTDDSGELRGHATVFTYDSIEGVARSEGMQPEGLPEVTAL